MKFPEDAPVTPAKKLALHALIDRLHVDLAAVDEKAVKGTGPGGQKVNKTQSGVQLRYQLGQELVLVKWTRERQHSLNRYLALRELCEEIEVRISPQTSPRLREYERLRKQKDRNHRRALQRQEPPQKAELVPPPKFSDPTSETDDENDKRGQD
jgi:protein subunit release factor B